MNDGRYAEAITAFEAMDGYRDSAAMIEECRTALKDIDYDAAVALMEAGMYDDSIAAFETMNGYRDSAAMIEKCRLALKDAAYNAAVAQMKAGKYQEAYKAFTAMDYKDSRDKAAECLFLIQKAGVAAAKKGSTVKFGYYEQDNNTANGKEEIEWTVLAVEGKKVLLISKDVLDCKPFSTSHANTTWESSSVRSWLNSTFLNAAFSANHQKLISTVSVSAGKNSRYNTNPGNETRDKVFLLSAAEAEKYLTTAASRQGAPTAYAKAQGAWVSGKTEKGIGTCWWWLRSPGSSQTNAATVFGDGSVYYHGLGVSADDNGVRPALWVDLSA